MTYTQLSLDGPSTPWPTSYRIERSSDGMSIRAFVVSADVPGVGRLTVRDRFLFQANEQMQNRIAAALATRPGEMFA